MPCCSNDTCSSNVAAAGRYRAVLWIVLAINAVMFAVEIIAGLAAGSAALQADALDFFADAANYGISLFVLGMTLRWRSVAALVKGASMGLFGLWVIASVIWHALHGTVPAWGGNGRGGCCRIAGQRGLPSLALCLA
ncbi:cation transporter [Thioclava sp.]|uniref:cation transporter n=1 Tax=Thioclava sp. TaxID=1933450 RepID=UPI003AA9A24B